MSAKLLLCLSNDQATIAVWRGRRLQSVTRFDNHEEGWLAFESFLRGRPSLPVHIIVDTVEEDFRFETLPHIRGRDRTEMVGRKLRQLYRATPYCSFALQDRETAKRRDDRYLFAALTNPELLAPWLQAIEANGMPVSGIYPLALVSASLIDRLKLKHPNLLIASKNSAGLRQTFFKHLKFRISRLTPLRVDADLADQHYADEIGNTRMYLDALTVTHVDDTLQLIILDLDNSLARLPATIMQGRPNVQCQYLNLNDIHQQLGIPTADLLVSPDVLHLYLLGEQTPTLNFAPPQLRRTFQRYAAGRWIYAASGATLLGAMVWSAATVYHAMEIDGNADLVQRQTREYQSRYQQVTAEFPQAPTSTENLRNTVELAQQIRKSLRTPETMFALISRALDDSPQIQISHLAWHYGTDSLDRETTALQDAAPVRPSGPAKALAQSAIVRGEIRPFDGDYKHAMALVNAFASRIAEDDRVGAVRALRLPVNASSDLGLTGSTSVTTKKGNAEFEFAIVFKAGV